MDAVDVAKKVLELAELMDWEGILSVLGTEQITKSTPTAAMRKQYMKISLLIHPDKLTSRFSDATKAFQVSSHSRHVSAPPGVRYGQTRPPASKTRSRGSRWSAPHPAAHTAPTRSTVPRRRW